MSFIHNSVSAKDQVVVDISQKTLILETFDAVTEHLIKSLESMKTKLSDFTSVHAMWIIVSHLVTTPTMQIGNSI